MSRIALLAGLLLAQFATAGLAQQYEIQTHASWSWAHYYRLIGLGDVREKAHPSEQAIVEAHCQFLNENTPGKWYPLGLSQRGYRLCYRTGPFSPSQAAVMCNRLQMRVKENSENRILCSAGFLGIPGKG